MLVVLFGLGGAFFMTAGRTLFQERATPASRGRVLSVYTLAFMGASGAIGAPLSGWLQRELRPGGDVRHLRGPDARHDRPGDR